MSTRSLHPVRPSHALVAVALGLTLLSAATAPTLARAAPAAPVRYATPPSIGSLLEPQSGLFRCADKAAARSSAETGFLARGCVRVERGGVWRVVACTDATSLSHGPYRLVEVVSNEGVTAWVPLPWHDWA